MSQKQLSCRQHWISEVLLWFRSCGYCSWWRIAQAVDQAEYARENRPRQRHLGHLEDGVAAMAHEPGAGLDQPLAQRGQRPSLDGIGRRQRAQEDRQILGQRVKLEADGVGREAHAREARPFERILALLDVLLGGAPTVVEGQLPLVR